MATRMQQRKGTAAQWISTNDGDGPVLNAGEIGFELDTNKFKIGDGVNHWVDLTYFADIDSALAAVNNLVDGAPNLLNTLNEIAAAIGDDPAFFTTVATNLSNHESDTTSVHGIANTAALATQTYVGNAISTHLAVTTNVHGITDTSVLETTSGSQSKIDNAISTHNSDTTNVHGIADTAELATKAYADGALSYADNAVTTHTSDSTNVHGIADTSLLVTTTGTQTLSAKTLESPTVTIDAVIISSTEISYLDGVTSSIQTQLNAKAPLASPTFTGTVAGITKTMVGLGNVDNTTDANKPVSTATQTALDLKAPLADPTFTGTVSGVTKSHVGLGNVDNTSDASKPVSTAQAEAIAAAQAAAISDATSQVNALITGAPAAMNTLDELAAALGDDANFASTVTNNLALKASLDNPTFSGTVTVAASGVAFTDGTQTKEGVPSRTPISQKTASYTLSALTEKDNLVEMSSSSAITLTIPTDATLNFPIGTSLDILQTSTGQVTIEGAGGVTVNATPGLKLRTTWSSATLMKRAADSWVVFGDLTA